MLERIIAIAVVLGAAYWYWSGPYQDKVNPPYDMLLQQNKENMEKCVRTKMFAAGTGGTGGTGSSVKSAERNCAKELNMYDDEDGRWHSYEATRPAG